MKPSDLLYSSQQTGQTPRHRNQCRGSCKIYLECANETRSNCCLDNDGHYQLRHRPCPLSGRADPAALPSPTQKDEFSDADCAALLDAGIASLHAGLKLSPEQEKLWPAVETALRTAGKSAMGRYQKFKNEPADRNLIDRIRQRGENAVARGQNIEAIADAAAPLYATLSEEQKHRLPVLMHGIRSHLFHHQFAMMGDNRENWRGHRDGLGGMEPERGGVPGRDIR